MRSVAMPRSAFQRCKPKRAGRPSWKVADDYRRHLRHLPCAACGAPAGQPLNPMRAAHVDHAGGKGMGTKVADRHCIPLCDLCHTDQHAVGWLTFEKRLPGQSAVALAGVYWTEWPGRIAWEREQAASADARVPA